jgi:nucleotide-binding universal stress UspA family protein
MSPEENCPEERYDKLLVATDLSIFSEGAITEAINFAGQCSSFLYILTVIAESPAYEILGDGHMQKKEHEAREYLESIQARIEEENLSCEVLLRHGDNPARVILDEADRKDVGMIVVGRHGRTEMERLIMGSVSSEVIAKARRKVLVAAIGTRIEYKNILVATDGSPHAAAAVAEAIKIARSCGSHLLVVSVLHAKRELKEAEELVGKIAGQAGKEGVTVETMTPSGQPPDVIADIAHDRKVDLIVMGTFGETWLKHMLMGTTTEKVIQLAHCAVLVVNPSR